MLPQQTISVSWQSFGLVPARPSFLQCLDSQRLKVFVQSLGMLIEVSQEDVTNLSVRCFLWDAGPKASKTKRFNYSGTPASPKRILNVRVVGKVLAAGRQYEICGVCIGLCDCRSTRRQQHHENQHTTGVIHLQNAPRANEGAIVAIIFAKDQRAARLFT